MCVLGSGGSVLLLCVWALFVVVGFFILFCFVFGGGGGGGCFC